MAFEKAPIEKEAVKAGVELLKNMGLNISAGLAVEVLKKIVGM